MKKVIIVLVLLILAVAAVYYINNRRTVNQTPVAEPIVAEQPVVIEEVDQPVPTSVRIKASNPIDDFAKCIANSGAKFYGAFWCSHCNNQKALFGLAVEYLPYIECSTPSGSGQTPQCADAKITGYPTWEFADGSRESGELSFDILSNKTSCAFPKTQL